jgi:hypothetical protein
LCPATLSSCAERHKKRTPKCEKKIQEKKRVLRVFVASSVEVRNYKVADGVKMMKLQKKR